MNPSDEKKMLEKIIQGCRNSIKQINEKDIKEIQEQLKILKDLLSTKEIIDSEKSKDYWEKAKLGGGYFLKGERSYEKALHAITKILDILRGETLTITIQKIQRNSKGDIVDITTYKGKESSLIVKNNGKYHQVEYDLTASLEYLETVEKANLAYINHYANFYKIANEHIKSTRSHSSRTGWRKRVNEGNIVEAFQRHMIMRHGLNEDEYTEPFDVQEILILLYYSIGNTPWWQQGDIGYNQIKASNNAKLASNISIAKVASKIVEMFSDLNNFNINDFNEMFTAHDQKELLDIRQLAENEVKDILQQIKESGRFK